MGPRIAAIGDSITLGIGDAGDVRGWASHVAHALDASVYLNVAANGVRARDLALSQVPTALMAQPDIVLCSVGGNDALRGDFSPDEVRECVTDALTRLRRPGRRVLVATIDRIGLFDLLPQSISEVMARRASTVNRALVEAAHESGAELLDGATVFASLGKRSWHVDRIHPSPLGHRALAVQATLQLECDWATVRDLDAPPPPPPLWAQAVWLAWCGVPWAVKRSRDLLPNIAKAVAQDLRAERALKS